MPPTDINSVLCDVNKKNRKSVIFIRKMYTKAGFILNLGVYSETLQGVVPAFSLTFIRNQEYVVCDSACTRAG